MEEEEEAVVNFHFFSKYFSTSFYCVNFILGPKIFDGFRNKSAGFRNFVIGHNVIFLF